MDCAKLAMHADNAAYVKYIVYVSGQPCDNKDYVVDDEDIPMNIVLNL